MHDFPSLWTSIQNQIKGRKIRDESELWVTLRVRGVAIFLISQFDAPLDDFFLVLISLRAQSLVGLCTHGFADFYNQVVGHAADI